MSLTGTVKFFSQKKGFGFITQPDGTETFVHQKQVIGNPLQTNDQVTCDLGVDETTGRPAAIGVRGGTGTPFQFAKGFAKGGIDRGVASSLFPEKDKFVAQCLATYPQLKKAKDALKFGYKVSYPGLLEKRPEAKEVTELSEDMQDNAFEKMKKGLGF